MAPPMEVDEDVDNPREGRRSKRERKGSSKAKKALDQIRKYRETGEKASYEVEEQTALYDVVDENQYAKIVRQRQEEDWIVDDDGSGYIDDGREIFDDDLNEAPEDAAAAKKGKQGASKPKINANKITNLFMAKSKKKKEEDVSVSNDDVLDDILQTIKTSNPLEKSSDKKVHSRKTPKRPSDRMHPPRRLQSLESDSYERKPVIKLKTSKEDSKRSRASTASTTREETSDNFDDDDNNLTEDIDVKEKQNDLETALDFGNGNDLDTNMDMGDDIEITEEDEKKRKTEIKEETDDSQEPGIHCTWEEILEKNQVEEDKQAFTDTVVDSSSLPLTDVNGENVLRFFWLDAYEDSYHQPGTVYLFGKVFVESAKKHVSCCVTVKNIERRLFLLPRKHKLDKNGTKTDEEVAMKDVYEEFNNIATKMKIMNFKCKPIKKKYAFELPDVPLESDYLEILYPADQPQLPKDLRGNTFTHIFGTNTSSLETFLVSRKLKGPSWIDVKYPQLPKQSVSWCKIEAVVAKPDFVEVVSEQAAGPPLTVLSLTIRTLKNSKSQAHEILGVTGLIQNELYLDKAAPKNVFNHCFCFVTKPTEHLLPYDFQKIIQNEKRQIQTFASERSLLGLLLARMQMIDPDIIVGHDVNGFDFDVLLHRISANKVPHWSKIGRLKRQSMPKLSGSSHGSKSFGEKNAACGRYVCDTKISAKELIRCKSYDITELTHVILNNIVREEVDINDVPAKLENSRDLLKLLDITTMDALYNLRIVYELNALPLAYQITGICGNILSRTLQGGRSERNEFLLLHAFAKESYICPDKSYFKKPDVHVNEDGEENEATKKGKGRKKPQFAGGLVLEPKKGLYDKFILLLDFNSLYPSIIQEYNICFTTVNRQAVAEEEDSLPEFPDSSLPAGILPTEIRKLVERRKQVKGMMKTVARDSDMYSQYDIRQKALKLTANSMYGCLGFTHSRFHAKPLAAMVTMKGREILMKTKDLVQGLNLDVIYGDTDSIMINTNSTDFDEVYKIGNRVKNEVNKLYRLLEIDIDGVYKSMLLLKKKKYAAVSVTKLDNGEIVEKKELKGLDIVRRDWCNLAKETGLFAINQILSCQSCDVIVENIHEYLLTVKEKVQADRIPTRKFEISKALSKAPEDYPDKKSLPHVTVAQRLMSQGKRVVVGDTISYIICDDGSNLPATQRAYHPDEFVKSTTLKIDYKYYLAHQVHPVISRLCDPIAGTDAAQIADCLGLDASNYSSGPSHHNDANETHGPRAFMPDEERFNDVEKFKVFCKNESCRIFKEEVPFEGKFSKEKDPWRCSECNLQYDTTRIMNQLTIFIRKHINLYYQGWLLCDERICEKRTKLNNLQKDMSGNLCSDCVTGHMRQIYSEGKLYNQLYYLQKVFDGKHPASTSKSAGGQNTFSQKMEQLLKKNRFSTVHLATLF